MNTRALFVSDIHIASAEDPKYGVFLRFLDKCLSDGVTQLFLVGDIFDFWIADRRFLRATYSEAILKIKALVDRGVRVHYFEGNHDLDLKAFWQRELGVDVHDGAAYFQFGPIVARVEHGDQMDPDDRGYLFLRWLLRTPLMVWLARNLPEFVVEWLGRRASATSRDYTTNVKTATEEEVRAKIRVHAAKAFAEKPFDVLVTGHVHVAEDSMQGHYRSIGLGTWLKEPLVFEIESDQLRLRRVEDFLAGRR